MALRRAARIEQVVDVVEGRAFLARDRAIAPTAHRDHVLQGEEIVLGLRDRDTEGDVCVGLAIDLGHAELVAHDLCRIDSIRRRLARACKDRLPRGERDEDHDQQTKQRPRAALYPNHRNCNSQSLLSAIVACARLEIKRWLLRHEGAL